MATEAQSVEPKTKNSPWAHEQVEGIHQAMQSLAEGKGIPHERILKKWEQKLEAISL